MPIPLPAIALGAKIIGGAASAYGANRQANAQRKLDAEQFALERGDRLRTEARDNSLTDQDRSYQRSQQAAMNPIRGQVYGAMLAKMGMGGMPQTRRMMNPNSTHNIGPVKVNPAAAAPPPPNPEREKMQEQLDQMKAWQSAGGGRAKLANKVIPRLQQAMNAKFGGYR